jgi:hypothetical protein
MHPYREAPVTTTRRPRIDPEDLVLYGLLMVIGVIPVLITVIDGGVFGFDATLGLMMLVVGAVGVLYHVARGRWRPLE